MANGRAESSYSLLPIVSRRLGGVSGELLALLDGFFDRADHVEGGFREMIVLAFANSLEALDGIGEVNELARRAGEDFKDR